MLHPTASRVLEHAAPFDGPGVFRFLAARAIPGVESAVLGDESVYARSLRAPSGPAVAEVRWDGRQLTLRSSLTDPSDEAVVTERMRRLFDLDAPAAEIDATLARHPLLRPLVEATPGVRIPGAVDGAEIMARAIVGQQISVVAALGHLTELASSGDELATPVGEIRRLFPTPQQLADGGADLLRGPAARRDTLRSLSSALARGVLRIGAHRDPDELRRELVSYRGIGPWTADYVALRVLSAPDLMMPGDSALRLGLRRLGVDEGLVAFAEPFRPWRSYLALHLWSNAAAPGSP